MREAAVVRKSFLKSDVTIVAIGQLFQQVLTVGTGIAIARLLGSSGYGLVNLLRALFTAVITLAPLGLDLALLKYSGQNARNPGLVLATVQRLRSIVFVLNLALALLVGLGLSRFLMHLYPYDGFDRMLLVTMLGVPFAADLAILSALYKGMNRPGVFALMTLYLQPALRVILVGGAWFANADTFVIVCINSVQILISALAVTLHLRRLDVLKGQAIPAAPPWRELTSILGASTWMAMSLFIYGMMRFVDILILGALATPKDVGEYAALSTIAQLVQVYPLAASQTLGPTVSRLYHEGDRPGVQSALNNYIYMASIVASFIFAGIAAFGDRLDLVFGSSFHFGSVIAFLMPLGYLISATLAPTGYALSMTGRHRSEFIVLGAGAISLVGLCYLLIPILGQIGAAIASASSFMVVNCLRFTYVSRVLGFVPGRLRDLLPPIFGLATAFLARGFVDTLAPRSFSNLVAGCSFYALLYALVTALFVASQGGLKDGLVKLRARLGIP